MPSKPNILLLISDEHSFRFFGHVSEAEGGENVRTPNLDKLARSSAIFSNAYCASPLCVPSRMTMLTGLGVQEAGAWGNQSILDPALDTMPKMLGRAGYSTCLVGKMHFRGRLQFYGFDHRPYGDLAGNGSHQYEWAIPLDAADVSAGGERRRVHDKVIARSKDDTGVTKIPESLTVDRIIAEETLAHLRERRASQPDRPWFVCASFSRPHFPLTAPRRHVQRYRPEDIDPPRVPATGDSYDHPVAVAAREGFHVGRIDHDEMMKARASYFACVSYIDEIIGDLLTDLEGDGLLNDTIVIYASDHGEMAGEHGTWWKSIWNEASARVPLFVSLPEHRSGALAPGRFTTPVSLLDLMPTLAAFADAAPSSNWAGADLSSALRSGSEPPERPIVCDHLNARWGPGSEFRMVRLRQYKLVRFGSFAPLLFDLAADPQEQRNVYSHNDSLIAAARDELVAAAERGLNFGELGTIREGAERLRRLYAWNGGVHLPNQYMMPSGMIVDADTPIYRPHVVADRLDDAIPDRPDVPDAR